MTVAELIEALQRMPSQDSDVIVPIMYQDTDVLDGVVTGVYSGGLGRPVELEVG